MAIVLAIKDSEGTLVYDLILNDAASNVHVDYPSIVLNPLGDGMYDISYRMMAANEYTEDTLDNIGDLDSICYQINRYGNNPVTAPQLWLHEKSNSEWAERRAILTSASFQPTWEGSVGALMVANNGWIGLLRMTRGDWEEIDSIDDFETMEPGPVPEQPKIAYWNRVIPGTLEARVERLQIKANEVVKFFEITAGYRAENRDISNYQPVSNMGAGLFDVDGIAISAGGPTLPYEMIPFGTEDNFTYPDNQADPTYIGYLHHLNNQAAYTHYIYLNEISGSIYDSSNDDYSANYEIFARIAFDNATPDVYHKIQLGHGDVRKNLIQNDAVYLTGTERPQETGTVSEWYQISLGKISLPQNEFSVQIQSEYLRYFTLALTTEIIGTPATDADIIVDSLLLMPEHSVTMSEAEFSIAGPQFKPDVSLIVGQTPTGVGGFVMDIPYVTVEATGSARVQPGNATLVVAANVLVDVLDGSIEIETEIIAKHLNIKATGV